MATSKTAPLQGFVLTPRHVSLLAKTKNPEMPPRLSFRERLALSVASTSYSPSGHLASSPHVLSGDYPSPHRSSKDANSFRGACGDTSLRDDSSAHVATAPSTSAKFGVADVLKLEPDDRKLEPDVLKVATTAGPPFSPSLSTPSVCADDDVSCTASVSQAIDFSSPASSYGASTRSDRFVAYSPAVSFSSLPSPSPFGASPLTLTGLQLEPPSSPRTESSSSTCSLSELLASDSESTDLLLDQEVEKVLTEALAKKRLEKLHRQQLLRRKTAVPLDEATTVPVGEATTVPVGKATSVPVCEAFSVPAGKAASVPVREAQDPLKGTVLLGEPATPLIKSKATEKFVNKKAVRTAGVKFAHDTREERLPKRTEPQFRADFGAHLGAGGSAGRTSVEDVSHSDASSSSISRKRKRAETVAPFPPAASAPSSAASSPSPRDAAMTAKLTIGSLPFPSLSEVLAKLRGSPTRSSLMCVKGFAKPRPVQPRVQWPSHFEKLFLLFKCLVSCTFRHLPSQNKLLTNVHSTTGVCRRRLCRESDPPVCSFREP